MFPSDAIASFADAPGREVAWHPGMVAALAAFLEGAPTISGRATQLRGPNGLRFTSIDPSFLPRLATIGEPMRDFSDCVCRFSSDVGHAEEHGEPMKLTPREYADLPLETIRARTTRLEDLEPFYREQLQPCLDSWHAGFEELLALAPAVEPGFGVFCILSNDR